MTAVKNMSFIPILEIILGFSVVFFLFSSNSVSRRMYQTLTLREAWRVVINVRDHYGHCGGAGETAHLPCHVGRLDDQLVTILGLAVQICHSCHYDP